MFLPYFQKIQISCLSVSLLVSLLPYLNQAIQGYLLSLMRYFSEMFLRHSGDVFTPFPNNCKLFGCLSVCQLAYFLTEIRPIQGYLLSLMRYFSQIFFRHSWEAFTLYPDSCIFLVWLLVLQLAYFINEFFWRHSQDSFSSFGQIWQGTFLDPSIKILEETIRWTTQSPYLIHKMTNSWLFLLYLCLYVFEMFNFLTNIP